MRLVNNVKEFLKKCSFKERLFYTLLGIGTFESILAVCSTVAAELGWQAIVSASLCGVFLLLVLVYTILSHNVERASILTCVGFDFFIFPLNYIVSGGMNGGMPMYFVCGAVIIRFLIPNGKRSVFTIAYLVLCSMMFIGEYYYPEIIITYTNRESQVSDMIMSLWITSALLGWGIKALLDGYEKEHRETMLLNQRLRELAVYDGLTTLYNRRYLMKLLDNEFQSALSEHNYLTIIMFDIDYFKQINDTYGHLTGDNILRSVSAILNEFKSENDFVGRYGGEEFIMVTPGRSMEAAYQKAENIRQEIGRRVLLNSHKITISGGIGVYEPRMVSIEQLIAQADENLYKAKYSGRNKVICA